MVSRRTRVAPPSSPSLSRRRFREKLTREPLNKSLNASAFTPSFLRKQEPKTLWTKVPAFAGTTGRDKHPGHGLIQRFPKLSFGKTVRVPAFAGTTGRDKHPSHGLVQRFLNFPSARLSGFLPSQERRVGINTQVTDLFRGSLNFPSARLSGFLPSQERRVGTPRSRTYSEVP